MNRFALLAYGARKRGIAEIFQSLEKGRCLAGDSVLTCFGNDFALVSEVIGSDRKGLLAATGSLKDVLVRSKALKGRCPAQPGNMVVTLHGQNRAETICRFLKILDDTRSELTGMETKAVAEGRLLIIAAEVFCPGRAFKKALKSRLSALARSLKITHSVHEIAPEEII